jgi:catechol 2,3-dioxygenase-like lactoylglutathione lyase family enzyme
MRLQHVSIPFTRGNEEELRAFYGGVLGLEEKRPPQVLDPLGVVWFAAGDGELELHFLPEDAIDTRSGRHFCLDVDDLDLVRERLAAAGHEVAETSQIPNRARFFTCDPFGNRVEVTRISGDYASG